MSFKSILIIVTVSFVLPFHWEEIATRVVCTRSGKVCHGLQKVDIFVSPQKAGDTYFEFYKCCVLARFDFISSFFLSFD